MTNLAGMHDRESTALGITDTWVLDTVALSENPAPPTYDPAYSWITRLNWGYGSTGTLPAPISYGAFAQSAADYVAESSGCSRWIIGNEPNLSREWPNGQPIFPNEYATCYTLCRRAIHSIPGHERDEVLIAASGPWNNELKYEGNPNGDWIKYFEDVISVVGTKCDGFSIHAYTHGYNVALVTSSARMQAPFQSRHYEFRTYQDYLEAIPDALAHLPVYLTEANGNGPWQAVGLMPAMLNEADGWNQTHKPKVHALIFYRYPKYDGFFIEGRQDVINEYKAAVGKGYTSPARETSVTDTFIPTINPGTSPIVPSLPPRNIDPRATARGVKVKTPILLKGETYWRAVRVEWLDEQQSQGRHHIYIDALDEQGKRVVGLPIGIAWPGNGHLTQTEAKPGEPYSANYPMSPSRNEFGVRVAGEVTSEEVVGIGMGADTPSGFNAGIHTSTGVVFQLVTHSAASVQAQPQAAPQPAPVVVPTLTHPIQDPALRVISQRFGDNPEDYARFGLKGHNGLDFAVAVGTPIRAVDAGVLIEEGMDEDGYGLYAKVKHSWGESLYAHLSMIVIVKGHHVTAGHPLGKSGNTGNSTGPHLHFAMRINPYKRGGDFDGYSDPLPYLSATTQPSQTSTNIVQLIKDAAQEFGVEWQLVAALAWSESSFNPRAESNAGAKGLMQLMPPTWNEWSAKVGGIDIFKPSHNLRVGTAYLAWLIRYFKGDIYKAVVAYNFGVGNVEQGIKPPEETIVYAERVLSGRDLLKAVGA